MPQDDEKDPEMGTDSAKVDRILSGMKGARMPDILKVQSSESKGEKFASYQGSHALKPGEDTQDLQPAVLVDQTQQDGISASEIASLRAERRERNRREATTAVIELERIPKKKSNKPLVVFLALLGVAVLGLFVKSRLGSPDESGSIAPATAASVVETTQSTLPAPPPVTAAPTAVAETTAAATAAATTTATTTIEPNSAGISASAQPSASSSSHPSTNHASAAASGSTDPDLLLFKPHRTP